MRGVEYGVRGERGGVEGRALLSGALLAGVESCVAGGVLPGR